MLSPFYKERNYIHYFKIGAFLKNKHINNFENVVLQNRTNRGKKHEMVTQPMTNVWEKQRKE